MSGTIKGEKKINEQSPRMCLFFRRERGGRQCQIMLEERSPKVIFLKH